MDHQPNSGWIWPAPTPTPTGTKRKAEYYDSWEERAFAEDAGGVLGSSGCVWPPRSYSCSFCRREFRSAQALGGHMNVHRRDRARLKQLPNTTQSPPPPPLKQTLIPDSTFPKPDLNYKKCPSQGLTTLLYGSNSSPNPNPNHSNNTLLTSHHRPNYAERKCLNSDLSISLNLVVRTSIHGDEASSCFKRRKIVATSPEPSLPLIFSTKPGEIDHNNKIILTHSTSSKEIDLELRLGG